MNNQYTGTIIGGIFSGISFFLTFTIVIPALSLFPGAIIESLAKLFVDNEPYSNVVQTSIYVLCILFTLTIIVSLIYVRKQVKQKGKLYKKEIIFIMILFWLIVHPLVFDIFWATKWNYASDGQLILGAIETFPISSIWFLIMGILIDIVKNTTKSINIE